MSKKYHQVWECNMNVPWIVSCTGLDSYRIQVINVAYMEEALLESFAALQLHLSR